MGEAEDLTSDALLTGLSCLPSPHVFIFIWGRRVVWFETGSYSLADPDLELNAVFLQLLPECGDYKPEPPCPAFLYRFLTICESLCRMLYITYMILRAANAESHHPILQWQ